MKFGLLLMYWYYCYCNY